MKVVLDDDFVWYHGNREAYVLERWHVHHVVNILDVHDNKSSVGHGDGAIQ